MNKAFRLLVIVIVSLTGGSASAGNCLEEPPISPVGGGSIHRSPKRINPVSATYNSCSTLLTVKFPITNGGKVEIYRNGVKVVNTSAAAGASLSYVLRNYGKGNYTIIVSCGNTVVYDNNVVIKN